LKQQGASVCLEEPVIANGISRHVNGKAGANGNVNGSANGNGKAKAEVHPSPIVQAA
jgi:hypothetical protein